ncbi:hypothetical protein QE152_g21557 [Popillia japonica]|uniref:Uncharacterized protein n=1 Tax=Popillia japonica TaxID=7064 RepID=A0AAW1KNS0_POPJA
MIEACKRRQEHHYDSHESVDTPPQEVGSVWQDLKDRHFLVYIFNIKTGTALNGVRILPYVVLSSSVITDENKHNYRMVYKNTNDNIVTAVKFSLFPVEGGKTSFVLMLLEKAPSKITTIMLNTVEIVTRLDPIDLTHCYVHFIESQDFWKKAVHLELIASESNNGILTTKPSHLWSTVTNLTGVPLICDDRVVGMRINEKEHDRRYTFYDIRPKDYWLLSKIHPNGFYDYNYEQVTTPLARAPSLFDFNRTKIISVLLITYLCSYIRQ